VLSVDKYETNAINFIKENNQTKARKKNITVSDSKNTTSLANKLTTIEAIILLRSNEAQASQQATSNDKQCVKKAKIETTNYELKRRQSDRGRGISKGGGDR